MSIQKDTMQIDLSEKSIILMSSTMVNAYKGRCHPFGHTITLVRTDVPDRPGFSFQADQVGADLSASGSKFLYRMALPPGRYELQDITGSSGDQDPGFFSIPLLGDLVVGSNSITYAGRLVARTRERKSDEFRAGRFFPILNQTVVSGYYHSTWDAEFVDDSLTDLPLFRDAFPVLNDLDIKKSTLPVWDRVKVQAYLDRK